MPNDLTLILFAFSFGNFFLVSVDVFSHSFQFRFLFGGQILRSGAAAFTRRPKLSLHHQFALRFLATVNARDRRVVVGVAKATKRLLSVRNSVVPSQANARLIFRLTSAATFRRNNDWVELRLQDANGGLQMTQQFSRSVLFMLMFESLRFFSRYASKEQAYTYVSSMSLKHKQNV